MLISFCHCPLILFVPAILLNALFCAPLILLLTPFTPPTPFSSSLDIDIHLTKYSTKLAHSFATSFSSYDTTLSVEYNLLIKSTCTPPPPSPCS